MTALPFHIMFMIAFAFPLNDRFISHKRKRALRGKCKHKPVSESAPVSISVRSPFYVLYNFVAILDQCVRHCFSI